MASISKVIVLRIGQTSSIEFEINESTNVLFVTIPIPIYFINTVQNQKKLAKNILKLVIKYLPQSDRTIVHLNSIIHYFVAKELVNSLHCKAILTQHYMEQHIQENDSGLDVAKQTYELVSSIITMSEYFKTKLSNNNIPSGKIRVIRNGIKINRLKRSEKDKLLNRYDINKSDKIILYHRVPNDTKEIEMLALTFNKFFLKNPHCRLIVIGNTDLENLIINTRTISSGISCLGSLPYDDIIGLYQMAYLGVLLTLNDYSNSIVLEMLHNGLPIVAFNIAGINEIYHHGENAFLINISQTNSERDFILYSIYFRRAIEKLLKNEELRNKFSFASQKSAKKLFTRKLMIRNYIKLSKELLNK